MQQFKLCNPCRASFQLLLVHSHKSFCCYSITLVIFHNIIPPLKNITMPAQDKYTDPELREEVKEEVKQSDKGGAPGQWSARKV